MAKERLDSDVVDTSTEESADITATHTDKSWLDLVERWSR
jgi:hypothetical protein